MKVLSSAVAALAIVSAGAFAGPSATAPATGPTRAEVMADTLLWRESGLDLYATMDSALYADPYDPRYAAAVAKYQRLRQSPRYAELVRRIDAGESGVTLRAR